MRNVELFEIEMIVQATLEQLGVLQPFMSQAEAFKMYGRGKVERWTKEGWINPVHDGTASKKRFGRLELISCARNNNCLNQFKRKPKQAKVK